MLYHGVLLYNNDLTGFNFNVFRISINTQAIACFEALLVYAGYKPPGYKPLRL